ncbi:MAG: hypothetical protein NTZ05_21640 [Chloroflexi bacterium]|nr:hypothetical protein [Chloroflexota bacterium]
MAPLPAVAALALSVLAAACGLRGPSTVGEPQPPPPACDGCAVLRLFAKEYAFEAERVAGPVYRDGAALAVGTGRTLIASRNIGRQVHILSITGPGVDYTTPVMGVGQENFFVADLAPGEYEVQSREDGNRQRGMWMRLAVQ